MKFANDFLDEFSRFGETMQQRNTVLNRVSGLLLVLSASLPFSVHAQSYGFKACVESALNQNPEMTLSSARINQAKAALSKAESSRMPQITVSMTASSSDNALNVFGMKLQQRSVVGSDLASPDNINYSGSRADFNTRIEMLVPVWNGGKISSYEDQASAMIEAAQKGDLAVQQYLTYNVYQAYEAVHAARSYIKVSKQALETAESFVKTTKNLVEQGIVVRSELLSAEVHKSNAKVAVLKAQGQEQIALDTLKMLMNTDANAVVDVAERVDLTLPVDSAGQLVPLALTSNLELEAKRKEAASTSLAVAAAKADYYPNFNVMVRKDWHDDSIGLNADSYTVAGVLSWKVTDFGVTRSSVDIANASALQKKAAVHSLENKVRLDVLSSWRKLQVAQQQVKASSLAVEQASEAQNLILKRYKSGVATITEVLASKTQLDKARADLVSANYDVNVHKAKLLLASGKMDINLL